MTSVAGVTDVPQAPHEDAWWYKDAGDDKGPASADELARLAAAGILRPDTLVWRSGFGRQWRRLEEAGLPRPEHAEAPPADHGRWTKVFAKIDANPKARPGSLLGLFLGPLAYFYLGMWTKGLLITSGWLAGLLFVTLLQDAMDAPTSMKIPNVALAFFCAHNLKRDYYRFRLLGERMWPRFRKADNAFACTAAGGLLLLAVCFAQLGNAADSLADDVAGVWGDGELKVFNDVEGRRKTITYGGAVHRVEMQSVDGAAGVIVFRDVTQPRTLLTFRKHYADDGTTFSLDFLVDDELVGNLSFLRPA